VNTDPVKDAIASVRASQEAPPLRPPTREEVLREYGRRVGTSSQAYRRRLAQERASRRLSADLLDALEREVTE
jgi:hypothetical protein